MEILSRDCNAILIPSGLKVSLTKGCAVQITHRLGGNFTVTGVFGMARIAGADYDAINQQPLPDTFSPHTETPATSPLATDNATQGAPEDDTPTDAQNLGNPAVETPQSAWAPRNLDELEGELWEAAKTVFDPEIPVNIVDLGLVYKMEMHREDDGRASVDAAITLTAPGCAMGPAIAEDLRLRLESLPSVSSAKVDIVWDPPWNKDMMSEEARMILGLA